MIETCQPDPTRPEKRAFLQVLMGIKTAFVLKQLQTKLTLRASGLHIRAKQLPATNPHNKRGVLRWFLQNPPEICTPTLSLRLQDDGDAPPLLPVWCISHSRDICLLKDRLFRDTCKMHHFMSLNITWRHLLGFGWSSCPLRHVWSK